ncbi:hypothetical protein FVE85_3679 [Porphyridium purpureum]|uniref:Uncharacterized protein n=1 Tax=Porphyridium purpureum TaxID=35688 RepID=A0A5J4YL81_PORPP|nr:hypothetical protein FVE85_3679 [Porphyridium purpureum]|eukprot:POR0834..scf249_10
MQRTINHRRPKFDLASRMPKRASFRHPARSAGDQVAARHGNARATGRVNQAPELPVQLLWRAPRKQPNDQELKLSFTESILGEIHLPLLPKCRLASLSGAAPARVIHRVHAHEKRLWSVFSQDMPMSIALFSRSRLCDLGNGTTEFVPTLHQDVDGENGCLLLAMVNSPVSTMYAGFVVTAQTKFLSDHWTARVSKARRVIDTKSIRAIEERCVTILVDFALHHKIKVPRWLALIICGESVDLGSRGADLSIPEMSLEEWDSVDSATVPICSSVRSAAASLISHRRFGFPEASPRELAGAAVSIVKQSVKMVFPSTLEKMQSRRRRAKNVLFFHEREYLKPLAQYRTVLPVARSSGKNRTRHVSQALLWCIFSSEHQKRYHSFPKGIIAAEESKSIKSWTLSFDGPPGADSDAADRRIPPRQDSPLYTRRTASASTQTSREHDLKSVVPSGLDLDLNAPVTFACDSLLQACRVISDPLEMLETVSNLEFREPCLHAERIMAKDCAFRDCDASTSSDRFHSDLVSTLVGGRAVVLIPALLDMLTLAGVLLNQCAIDTQSRFNSNRKDRLVSLWVGHLGSESFGPYAIAFLQAFLSSCRSDASAQIRVTKWTDLCCPARSIQNNGQNAVHQVYCVDFSQLQHALSRLQTLNFSYETIIADFTSGCHPFFSFESRTSERVLEAWAWLAQLRNVRTLSMFMNGSSGLEQDILFSQAKVRTVDAVHLFSSNDAVMEFFQRYGASSVCRFPCRAAESVQALDDILREELIAQLPSSSSPSKLSGIPAANLKRGLERLAEHLVFIGHAEIQRLRAQNLDPERDVQRMLLLYLTRVAQDFLLSHGYARAFAFLAAAQSEYESRVDLATVVACIRTMLRQVCRSLPPLLDFILDNEQEAHDEGHQHRALLITEDSEVTSALRDTQGMSTHECGFHLVCRDQVCADPDLLDTYSLVAELFISSTDAIASLPPAAEVVLQSRANRLLVKRLWIVGCDQTPAVSVCADGTAQAEHRDALIQRCDALVHRLRTLHAQHQLED